jgi:hypothetical protein
MENEKYEKIRKLYPEYISKDQLYVICKIAKRSAKYLLDNGIIPCVDSGKKTHRYRIALEDVITYLKQRDESGKTLIPRGASSSKYKARGPKFSYSQEILLGNEDEVRRYFEYIFDDFPDVLTSFDLSEMTGLSRNAILRFLAKGELKSLVIDNQRKVPKEYVLDFVVTPQFLNIKSNSRDFSRILGGFKIWKTAKL